MTLFLICSLTLVMWILSIQVKTGKDTLVAYIKGEDAGCKYLEVNEIIEDVWGINWKPLP